MFASNVYVTSHKCQKHKKIVINVRAVLKGHTFIKKRHAGQSCQRASAHRTTALNQGNMSLNHCLTISYYPPALLFPHPPATQNLIINQRSLTFPSILF